MKFSTPFTLLAMTLMSNTDARIGDNGGHRDLIDYSKLKKCNPKQNPTVTPQCLSVGKGYECMNVKLGSRKGDYRCLDRSQSTPTVAPTAAPTPTSKENCAHPGTGYFWCDETNECLPPSDHDKCESAKCTAQSASTGYSWCVSTSTCLAPGDDSCDIADCNTKSGNFDWCFSTRECLPSTDNCDPKFCTVDDDCNLPSVCNRIFGGKYQCY